MKISTKNTIKSVIVMTIIAGISVALLAIANNLFPKPVITIDIEEVRTQLEIILPADSYEIVELSGYNIDLDVFNAENGKSGAIYVEGAIVAKGGTNDGRYAILSAGAGYNGGLVRMITAYDDEGKIIGVTHVEVSNANNFFFEGKFQSALPAIYDSLIGKSGNIGGGSEILANTGATARITAKGMADAINIANSFIFELVKVKPMAFQKTFQLNQNAVLEGGYNG